MYCRKCGAKVADDVSFCPKCGADLNSGLYEAGDLDRGSGSGQEQRYDQYAKRTAGNYAVPDDRTDYTTRRGRYEDDYEYRAPRRSEGSRSRLITLISVIVIIAAVIVALVFVVLPKLNGTKDPAPQKTEQAVKADEEEKRNADEEEQQEERAEAEAEVKQEQSGGQVSMPDLTGKKLSEAKAELEAQGLRYVTEYEESSSVKGGCVIKTSVQPGEEVSADEKVVLYVAMAGNDDTAKEAGSETEKEPEYPVPVFSYASASSEAYYEDDSNHNDYDAMNALDGDRKTAWNEGNPGSGAGEWITFSASETQHVSGIRIKAGYAKSEKVYNNNSRPKEIVIQLSDGSDKMVTLKDLYDEYQEIAFQKPHDVNEITIFINSVYEGSKYEDCCITDVTFY